VITENLLEAIVRYQADIVILDITGVPVVDTQVANYLVTTTSACKLLGSRVVLVGIGGAIAQAMVHLGVDLSGIVTLANLQAGIAWTFDQLGLQVTRKEDGL
jgi:rsbT co-antagonist protein RsbR